MGGAVKYFPKKLFFIYLFFIYLFLFQLPTCKFFYWQINTYLLTYLWSPGLWNFFWKICKTLRPPPPPRYLMYALLLCKQKLPNIRQLQYPGGLNRKRKVNKFTQTKGGLTRIDLYDTICMIRLIWTCKVRNLNNFLP